jgi:hypothetical protein
MAAFGSRDLGCWVCSHVLTHARPALFVAREDGEWQFTCGAADHDPDDSHVVCVGHLIDQDRSLSECADLPDGFEAERSAVGEPWIRCQNRPADINAGETCDEPLSAPAAPRRSAAFEDLVVTATSYLRDCQESLKRSHFLDRWPRYDWSQETRQLIFSDRGRPKVVADIQFVGSVSIITDTWLWAWDNATIESELCEAMLKIRQYGVANAFPHLTVPKWRAQEVDGWEMTSIAALLLRAKGAYRTPGETGSTFMILTAIGWAT